MRTKLRRRQAKTYCSPEERALSKRKDKVVLTPPAPYRSWLEADVANSLMESGVDFTYEEDTLHYVVPAQTHTYRPDFKLPNGVFVETKGRWTAQDRKKMSLVIEQHPELNIHMLFALDNKISPNSRTCYSDWCTKRGIVHAFGTEVPKEWLREEQDG